jgi:hypothetical protein
MPERTMHDAMTLFDALRVLAMAHTREDYEAGYALEWSPRLFDDEHQADYVKAWGVVRAQLHMKIAPASAGGREGG